jgi:hypothetical protein
LSKGQLKYFFLLFKVELQFKLSNHSNLP